MFRLLLNSMATGYLDPVAVPRVPGLAQHLRDPALSLAFKVNQPWYHSAHCDTMAALLLLLAPFLVAADQRCVSIPTHRLDLKVVDTFLFLQFNGKMKENDHEPVDEFAVHHVRIESIWC